jgi:hypothetical protein
MLQPQGTNGQLTSHSSTLMFTKKIPCGGPLGCICLRTTLSFAAVAWDCYSWAPDAVRSAHALPQRRTVRSVQRRHLRSTPPASLGALLRPLRPKLSLPSFGRRRTLPSTQSGGPSAYIPADGGGITLSLCGALVVWPEASVSSSLVGLFING